MPQTTLLNQVYMFSETLDVNEALDSIKGCSHVFTTENFSKGIKELSSKLGLQLEPIHVRSSKGKYHPTEVELERLRTLLEPEFTLYRWIRQG